MFPGVVVPVSYCDNWGLLRFLDLWVLFFFLVKKIILLAMLHSLWDLSSLTRDQTCAPCRAIVES